VDERGIPHALDQMNQKYKTKLDQREVENEEKEKREKKQTL
jgi:hypothetical protein